MLYIIISLTLIAFAFLADTIKFYIDNTRNITSGKSRITDSKEVMRNFPQHSSTMEYAHDHAASTFEAERQNKELTQTVMSLTSDLTTVSFIPPRRKTKAVVGYLNSPCNNTKISFDDDSLADAASRNRRQLASY